MYRNIDYCIISYQWRTFYSKMDGDKVLGKVSGRKNSIPHLTPRSIVQDIKIYKTLQILYRVEKLVVQ